MSEGPIYLRLADAVALVAEIASSAGLEVHVVAEIQIVLPDDLVDELWRTADRDTLEFSEHPRESLLAGVRILRSSEQRRMKKRRPGKARNGQSVD